MKIISNKYLKRDRITKLLNEALKHKVTYISAPIGCGKTIAVQQLEEDINCNFFWFDCKKSDNLIIKEIKNYKYIVFENYNDINEINRECIDNYIKESTESKFIIISRKPIDENLKILFYEGKLMQIDTKDLNFTKMETAEFLKLNNIDFSTAELDAIFNDISGYAIITNVLTEFIKQERYNKRIYEAMKKYLFEYIDFNIFSKIDLETFKFMQKMSFINNITVNSINYILNINNSKLLLKKVSLSGTFLVEDKYGNYELLEIVRQYLNQKYISENDEEKINKIYLKAAEYYENIELNIVYASEYYILTKNYDKAAEILSKDSIHHVGIITYKELEKYILKIPEESMNKYPSLYITLAHIYMLYDKLEESSKWYQKFSAIKDYFINDTERYEKLKQIDMYYHICLPATNDIKLMDYFVLLSKMVKEGSILSTITFTGNQPSILSGGKDLSEWGKHYKIAYATLNPIVFRLFKENQYGAGEIGISEVLYLNNKIEESIQYVTKGISLSKNIDNLFVAYSILDKIALLKEETNDELDKFYEKIEKEKAWYLLPNYDARLMENNILFNKTDKINKWVEENYREVIDNFNALNKYKYYTLARGFIALEKYTNALIVLERLYEHVKKYNKRIFIMQYHILKAICLFRQNEEEKCFDNIEKAINMAKKFNYIRLFADEGSVMNEILEKYSKLNKNNIINTKFFNEVLQKTKEFGNIYPNKYKKNNIQSEELTKKEMEILKLIAKGRSNKEICEELSISIATVKTHINHIYSKLGTKNRIQTLNKLKEQ